MPDIQLRLHHDMLVFSAPLTCSLLRQGVEDAGELELLDLTEPESVREALRLEHVAGAQCLLTPTAGVTVARLAHLRLEEHAQEVAQAGLDMANYFKPQHVIAEIGATGLPIDPSSKSSLVANRDQYGDAVRAFGEEGVDAFFFNDLEGVDDARCALMGARRVTDLPVFASVCVDECGNLAGRSQGVEEAVAVMAEYGADVVGIRTGADVQSAASVVSRIADACDLPVLVQLDVQPEQSRLPKMYHESPYWSPDVMVDAALALRAAGAQFLRATGNASPSYTGALAAAVMGSASVR